MLNRFPKVHKLLWYAASLHPFLFFLFVLTSLYITLSFVVPPVIVDYVITSFEVSSNNDIGVENAVLEPLTIILSTVVCIEVLGRAHGFISCFLFPKIESETRMMLADYLYRFKGYEYFNTNQIGGVSLRVNGVAVSLTLIIATLVQDILPVILVVGCNFFLLVYNTTPIISELFFIWCGLYVIITLLALRNIVQTAEDHTDTVSILYSDIVDTLSNQLAVKVWNKHDYEMHRLEDKKNAELTLNKKNLLSLEILRLLLSVLSMVLLMVILFLTVSSWYQGDISLGVTVFVIVMSMKMLDVMEKTRDELPYLFREWGNVSRSVYMLLREGELLDEESQAELKPTKGEIEFDNVTFNYKRNENLFKNKSFKIPGGTKVGFVGLSGSGKTTCALLMLRLYKILSGDIRIDGQSIYKVSKDSLYHNMAFIPQEPTLFARSIRENIMYGNLDATEEEVISAAKKAHCHHFIMSLEDGYDTLLDENASNLSGGQKQRIVIARAFLCDPKIIIMDEPTSALDATTEKYVLNGLRNLLKGRTVIVIAHRLNTLKEMDNIFVFENGSIIESGNHDELIKNGEHYKVMWNAQVSGFLPDILEDI